MAKVSPKELKQTALLAVCAQTDLSAVRTERERERGHHFEERLAVNPETNGLEPDASGSQRVDEGPQSIELPLEILSKSSSWTLHKISGFQICQNRLRAQLQFEGQCTPNQLLILTKFQIRRSAQSRRRAKRLRVCRFRSGR